MQSFLGGGIILHNISTGVDSGSVFPGGSVSFPIDTSLADKELDSTKLNDLSWLELITQVLTIFFFKFTDDKISLLFGFNLAGVGLVSIETLVFIEFFLLGTVQF